MRKLILATLTILFSIIILSCSSNDDNNNQTFPFEGKWSGSYSGTKDHGTFKINVSSTGKVTGITTSAVFNEDFDVNGNVSESGNFSAIAGSASSGATFTGQMSGNNANGAWINISANMNGAWTGGKN